MITTENPPASRLGCNILPIWGFRPLTAIGLPEAVRRTKIERDRCDENRRLCSLRRYFRQTVLRKFLTARGTFRQATKPAGQPQGRRARGVLPARSGESASFRHSIANAF